MSTYYIHDNGDRPFAVTVAQRARKQFVTVKSLTNIPSGSDSEHGGFEPEESEYDHVVFENLQVQRVYKDDEDAEEENCAMLLQIKGDHHMFVGREIYEFHTDGEPLMFFRSNLGNNDVPYPYAVSRSFCYLFLENVLVRNETLISSDEEDEELDLAELYGELDPYDLYYKIEEAHKDRVLAEYGMSDWYKTRDRVEHDRNLVEVRRILDSVPKPYIVRGLVDHMVMQRDEYKEAPEFVSEYSTSLRDAYAAGVARGV